MGKSSLRKSYRSAEIHSAYSTALAEWAQISLSEEDQLTKASAEYLPAFMYISVCVYVCVWEREREREIKREGERERERECVCVLS